MVNREQRRSGLALVAPAVIFLAAMMIYPVISSLFLSFTDKTVGNPAKFIGLRNYASLFTTEIFVQTLSNTSIYVVFAVAAKLVLGLGLALLIERIRHGRSFFRAIVLLPWIVPVSLSVLAWKWLYDPSYGVINWVLYHTPSQGPPWLGDPNWARAAIIIVNVWVGTPFFAISLAAGLNAIPIELYESAIVDGAGEIRRFLSITLPLLVPVVTIVLLYSIVQTVSDFETVFVLTRGGPNNSTHLLGTLAFEIGLRGTQLGKGAAISLVLFPVLIISSFFAVRTVTREDL